MPPSNGRHINDPQAPTVQDPHDARRDVVCVSSERDLDERALNVYHVTQRGHRELTSRRDWEDEYIDEIHATS